MFPCVLLTSSGTSVEVWTKLWTQAHLPLNRKGGPSITDQKRNLMDTAKLDRHVYECLIRLFDERKVLPPETKGTEDITERFSAFRS